MPIPGVQVGSCSGGPLFTRFKVPGFRSEVRSEVYGSNFRSRVDYFEDFHGDVLPANLTSQDTSAAGSPTIGLVADQHQAEVVLAADNEVETVGFHFGDQQNFPANKRPIFEARFQLPVLPGAAARFVIGLMSAYNATLDSTTLNAWLRLEASATLLVECDDDTTNTDDQAAAGITTLVAATWYTTWIDFICQPGYVSYFLAEDGTGPQYLGRCTATAMPVTALQPVILLQKDSGVGVPSFKLDYWRVCGDRY